MNPERSRQSSQRLRTIEIWRTAKVDTSPIRTNYSHHSTPSMTVLMDRTHVFVINLWVSAETLIETTVYTALDEHDHINVGEQLESYMCMFQHGIPRETWQCIIMRGIEIVTHNYCENFRKCRLITRYQFSSTNHCTPTERSDGESLPHVHSVSVIVLGYGIVTNWKIIRACPAIFRRSQCTRTERHLFVWENRNPELAKFGTYNF